VIRANAAPVLPRNSRGSGARLSRPGVMRHDGLVTDRALVSRWLAGYELPVTGLGAIARMWDAEREGPDEVFTLATDILAVDGPVAVVRAEVRYGDPLRQEYRDLWVIRLADDGRCTWFEEWPYWPGRPFSARDDLP